MNEPSDQPGAVRFAVERGIAHLTFDRPHARNAMTWQMYDELAAACRQIDAEASIQLAVLRGAGGKAFVAGTDIEQFQGFLSGQDGVEYEDKIDAYISALEALRIPTIAVIEGWAVGGGLAIANACDLRIAVAGARFGAPIARTLGNCLSPENLRRLCATLGVNWVRRMVLAAETPTAEELAPLGYCAAIVPAAELDAKVREICERLSGHAPITMRATREMLRRLVFDPEPDAADLIRQCYGSEDFRTGVESFLLKQRPAWRNR